MMITKVGNVNLFEVSIPVLLIRKVLICLDSKALELYIPKKSTPVIIQQKQTYIESIIDLGLVIDGVHKSRRIESSNDHSN